MRRPVIPHVHISCEKCCSVGIRLPVQYRFRGGVSSEGEGGKIVRDGVDSEYGIDGGYRGDDDSGDVG